MIISIVNTMNTPRVKKQQEQLRKSLSAKKGPVKGLRNVLGQPYDTRWPALSEDGASNLEELLKKALPGLRRQTQSVPWSELRKLSKDERRAAREKLSLELKESKASNGSLNFVTLGINAVTRGLEKEELVSVLLDSGVEPLLIKHIIVMAQAKKVPILLIPFLKKVSLNHVGFASAALGLQKGAKDLSSPFHEVYQEILKFSQVVSEKKDPESENTVNNETEDVEMNVDNENVISTCFSLPEDIYKYRNTRKERTFVPPSATQAPAKDDETFEDFIAVTDENPETIVFRKNQRYMDVDEDEGKREEQAKGTTYLSLKVKRIQGNNNRVKATKLAKPKKKKVSNKK